MKTLRKAVREYLAMRRDLGFKMHGADRPLLDFISFLEKRRAGFITQQLALAWAQQASAAQPAEWARRLCFVRGFARHRSATDPRTQVPPYALLPHKPHRARPYLYSQAEIGRLLSAARKMAPGAGLRPWTYYCLFGLLSVSGMRIGEAQNLELEDLDLKNAVLTVRDAKFGKSRLVPLHASTCKVLAKYVRRREHFLSGREASHLLISQRGNRLDGGEIRRTFYALSRQIGLRGLSDSHGPRLHDMRHRFAVHTLLRWYRAGEDAERHLPTLSAYLGHVHVADTYWYLNAWPELMQEAMKRLERRWEDKP